MVVCEVLGVEVKSHICFYNNVLVIFHHLRHLRHLRITFTAFTIFTTFATFTIFTTFTTSTSPPLHTFSCSLLSFHFIFFSLHFFRLFSLLSLLGLFFKLSIFLCKLGFVLLTLFLRSVLQLLFILVEVISGCF